MNDPRQAALLVLTVVFVLFLTGLVVADISIYGVHLVDVVAVPIIAFFWVAVVGALRNRTRR